MADGLNLVGDWQSDQVAALDDSMPEYLAVIKDLPGSDADKIDLIRVLATIQMTIIRSHLGLDPVSLALEAQLVDKFKAKAANASPKVVKWTDHKSEREDQ